MRKIRTEEDIESDRKRKNRIFTFVILGILLFSSIGYAFFSNPNAGVTNNTNDPVQNLGGQWAVRFGDQLHYLSTSPENAKEVNLELNSKLSDYAGEIVYLDIQNQGIYNEIAVNLGPYVSRIQPACYENCTLDLPEKTCADNLIVWREGIGKVYQNNNCVFIEGDMKAADAFLYKLLGVN